VLRRGFVAATAIPAAKTTEVDENSRNTAVVVEMSRYLLFPAEAATD
jgi:hypothetical protein